MAFLWDPSMAVGVPLIDQQHQEFFRRVNSLLAVMHRGFARLETEHLLVFLAGYTAQHFKAEERLMERHAFPDKVPHRRAHAAFEQKLEALHAKFAAEGSTCDLSIAMNRMVCAWLREHTNSADVALARHLRAVGAQEADAAPPARAVRA
jgi:hemerythrin-like metal-binding protein